MYDKTYFFREIVVANDQQQQQKQQQHQCKSRKARKKEKKRVSKEKAHFGERSRVTRLKKMKVVRLSSRKAKMC